MRALLLLALAAAVASAHTITWTGIAEDNQWFNHINWSPAQVPTQNDDVIINQGMVLVAAAASCNSLTMGMLVGQTANITIFNAFAVGQGGMSINVNGNVIINSGPQQVFASATIQGSLNFIDGILAGQWTIAKGGSANLGNANEKGFVGCAFKNEGSMSLGGVIVLNQSSVFTFAAPITVTTDLILQNGDGSQVSFDASTTSFTYAGGTLTVQATFLLGQFTLQSGDIMILAPLTFASTLNIPKLSRISAFGAAILNMTGATGAGMIVAGCNSATFGNLQLSGEVNIIGGDVIFSGQSDMGILTLKGGNAVFMNNVYPAQLNVLSGTSAGSGSVIAAKVLVQTTGFTLNSRFVANGTATFEATTLPFGQYGAFEIAAGATGSAQGALLLTGPPFIPGFTNAGSFVANSAVSSQNINIQGAGTFQVVSKLTIGSATFSQSTVSLNSGAVFSGSNSFLTIKVVSSVSGGNVMAKLGDYNLVCKGECDNISTPNSAAPTSDFSFSA